jgi:GNAT superfamily N-acetyltransferase
MSMDFAGGGRLEVRITRSDVGKRVSVRRIGEVVDGRPVFVDAVGLLTSWDAGELVVTRRDGTAVHIAESSLVAGKVVPPARARRGLAAPPATIHTLQETAARGWPAQETERLGDWTLRAAAGFTRRANSALPAGDPGLPLPAAAERITAWYAERGLPAYIQAPGEELDAGLAALGWTAEARALMLTAPLAPVADRPGAERVTLSREIDDEWLARYHRAGAPGDAATLFSPGERPPVPPRKDQATGVARDDITRQSAMKVLTGGPSVWFAVVPGAASPRAIGRCVVDGRWAGFNAVEVDPAHRRQGLATAVMAALARNALTEGATGAYLQVEEENAGALAMYEGMGFALHHAYHYRRGPRP